MSTRTAVRTRPSTQTAHPHSHTSFSSPPLQRTSSKPGSSRPGTPSRIDIPVSRKSSSSNHKSPALPQHTALPMSEQPATPTPRKPRYPRKNNKSSNQRNAAVASESELGIDQEPSSEDEEMLFDLLGVMSPPKPSPKRGVLNLSKDDMDVALGKKTKPRRGRKDIAGVVENGSSTRNKESHSPGGKGGRTKSKKDYIQNDLNAESDQPKPAKAKRGKTALSTPQGVADTTTTPPVSNPNPDNLPSKPKSGIAATKPKNISKQQSNAQTRKQDEIPYSPFDTSTLSKSLPSGGLAQTPPVKSAKKGKKAVGSEDESAVWEMPSVDGGQDLTWQQKLSYNSSSPSESQSQSQSPRKSSKSTPSDKRKSNRCAPFQAAPAVSSPLNPRPVHGRRASADGVPLAGAATNGRTVSAFDSHIPFHTGFNVHRAPQTPAKGVASANGNISNGILPIVGSGEFPRIPNDFSARKSSLSASSGPGSTSNSTSASASNPLTVRYAGPTFHNSPNAASLSKPDLEDF